MSGNPITAIINPKLFWERFVIPHKLKPESTWEEKQWPEYVTYDPAAIPEQDEHLFMTMNKGTHDGNIANTYNLIWSVLEPIVFMRVAAVKFKGAANYNSIRYTIGDITIENQIDGSLILPNGTTQRGNIEIAKLPALSYPFMKH